MNGDIGVHSFEVSGVIFNCFFWHYDSISREFHKVRD